MKNVNVAVSDAIRKGYDITALPRLTVEWNLNRYTNTVQVDNDPTEDTKGYDIEMFPIESLIKPNRPTAGILKARVNEAKVADPYAPYNGLTRSARYYIGSVDDTYKYWTSPFPTDSAGVFPLHTDGITTVRPHVNYVGGVKTNRIVVGFEDTWAQPKDFTVRVQTEAGGTYNVIATNPIINDKGQVILNWNTTWSSSNTPNNDATKLPVLYGIQVRVESLKGVSTGSTSGANSHLSLIEISARRVHDMSDRLINVGDTFDMSEKSMIYPIGTITSNTGTVELFNGDGVLNNESDDLTYAGLMEPNAKFSLDYIYTINAVAYTVPQFVMYGGAWNGQRAETVSVELADFSKYFQEIKPRPSLFLGRSVTEIVWQICDTVGFVDYEIQSDDITDQHKIDVWFSDGEKTVWELFDELAQVTQTAIYFDAYGKLQVRTRTTAFKTDAPVSWTLRGENAGTELADIVTLDQTDELESNSIKVTYAQTDVDPVINGQPKNQVLWEPEGTVSLRACALYRDLLTTATYISLPPAETKIWPFEGMMNVEGELIKYKGKNFVYFDATGARKTVLVETQEEMEKWNEVTPFENRYKNHYNGELKITERGLWNSQIKDHFVQASGYSVRTILNGNRNATASGFSQNKAESRVYLEPNKRFKDSNDILLATRGTETDPGFAYYGYRIRFEKSGGKTQRAGIVIHNNTNNEDGYYIELTPSTKLSTGKKRANRHELTLHTRNNGKWKMQGKGTPLAIVEGTDYEVDVSYTTSGTNHVITVWVNGKNALTKTISGGDKNTYGGRFGMYVRGDSKVSYEYLYAHNRPEEIAPSDDFSYLDKIRGGYTGGQLDRELVYGWRTIRRRVKRKWTKIQDQYVIQVFDEFGPIVHEVREYDVTFEPKPAISARLYMGNDWSVVVPEFRADAFGAKFYVANASRTTAIANGEDTITYGSESAVINPIMSVIGRSITVKDSENIEVKNDAQIRKRGEIQTEINSDWIQSKEMAQAIADWIIAHWSKGADELSVSIFGNPLIELGDIVTVEYPDLDMKATTHKYFVVGTASQFDTGLETTLSLRRVVV